MFSDNYELKSLESTKSFIKENGHLPNTPSAESIKETGVSLKKMTILQQQKIEELTLYLIQMNEKISELEALIQTK